MYWMLPAYMWIPLHLIFPCVFLDPPWSCLWPVLWTSHGKFYIFLLISHKKFCAVLYTSSNILWYSWIIMFSHLTETKLRQILFRVSSWTAPLMASGLLLTTLVFVTTYLLCTCVCFIAHLPSLSFTLNKHNEQDAFLHSTYLQRLSVTQQSLSYSSEGYVLKISSPCIFN